jgi:hypothetical protein
MRSPGVMRAGLCPEHGERASPGHPVRTFEHWSGRWDLNPRPSRWQRDALPLSYTRVRAGCIRQIGGGRSYAASWDPLASTRALALTILALCRPLGHRTGMRQAIGPQSPPGNGARQETRPGNGARKRGPTLPVFAARSPVWVRVCCLMGGGSARSRRASRTSARLENPAT